MPLHDWTDLAGWEGLHLLWMSELQRYLKARLPLGYRAYLGSGPAVAVGAPPMRPDIGVRAHESQDSTKPPGAEASIHAIEPHQDEPDIEVAVATLDPAPSLFVERDSRLVAALELVSPRNKDRPVARTTYSGRYAAYLMEGVHLLLVDVHRRPFGFSFADQIAQEFQITGGQSLSPPMAVSYRVGEPAAGGGRLLGIWRRQLGVGEPLPTLPLPLAVEQSVVVDLESTYMAAAADAYLV